MSDVSNCTPHFDPGFLAIAVCSPDPGFRVWDAAAQQWVSGSACVEGPCRVALEDALVFVGMKCRVKFASCRLPTTPGSDARHMCCVVQANR